MYEKPNKTTANIFIKRDSLIKLKVSQGRGKDNIRSCELYRVLANFEKSPQKWFVSLDCKKEWHKTFPARKSRFLKIMVAEYGYFHKEDQNKNDSKWELKLIYAVRYASDFLDIQSTLTDIFILINEVIICTRLSH